MTTQDHCPIWGTECESVAQAETSVMVTDSPRAGGSYELYEDATPELSSMSDEEKARLTTLLVIQRRLGNACPPVNASTIAKAKSTDSLGMEERRTNLLRFLAESTLRPSQPVGMSKGLLGYLGLSEGEEEIAEWQNTLRGLAHTESQDPEDLEYLANSLTERGLIEKGDSQLGNWVIQFGFLCRVTVEGYVAIERTKTERKPDQCFVALWFNPETDALYDKAIAPAVETAGYKPIRIDRETNFIGKIDDQIIAEIRQSRFVIADFTHDERGARGSVYYEAGLAHGLDIPVLFTCRDDQIDELHFDTNHFLHLGWPADTPERLIEPLMNRIIANIGPGPHALLGENPTK